MPLDAAVAEAQKLAAEGYREIVINGIEISSWGQEWKDGSVLRDLLAAICAAVPDVRIRLARSNRGRSTKHSAAHWRASQISARSST